MELIKNINPASNNEDNSVVIDKWFEKFVDDIKTDHMLFSSGVAPKEKRELYDGLIFGNQIELISKLRDNSSMFFITQIITDYISEITNQDKKPIKLALGLTDSKILVWSVIEDDDEIMEDTLLITEAKVNGKYQKHGFYLTSTITERSDNLEIPPHYQSILD
jgi:hypothetical protein